jgi:hypothetical protein
MLGDITWWVWCRTKTASESRATCRHTKRLPAPPANVVSYLYMVSLHPSTPWNVAVSLSAAPLVAAQVACLVSIISIRAWKAAEDGAEKGVDGGR